MRLTEDEAEDHGAFGPPRREAVTAGNQRHFGRQGLNGRGAGAFWSNPAIV